MTTTSMDLTAAEQAELTRRQKGRLFGLIGFVLAMVVIVYVLALIRL
ncbi:hypothetical protein AA0472_3029 [Acetobacter estunensis NRIC 0472]|nr:hypothetical protein [Acetobacter estunensis]GBQ29614.1 hypothetical protein AA0472_3029 [Acetobacter estunensis NRIC 0472]